MRKELGITIPCHWDEETLDKIVRGNTGAKTPVTEIYGVLSRGGPVGHGRSPDAVVSVSRENATKFRERCRSGGLSFIYLLNAPFNFSGSPELEKQVDQYLDWIVGDFKADAVMISSHELMTHVRRRYPDLPICASTIAGIRTKAEMEEYLDVNPQRVVPHHDVGKRRHDLEEMVTLGRERGVEIELLATESCLYDCPRRRAHYEHLAKGAKDSPFHTSCNTQKLTHPSEFLMAGGVIRPEEMSDFGNIGVKHIKLSGRSKPAGWLPEVAAAYQQGDYRGNLVRLLGVDPSLKAEEWIFLNNSALDGFREGLPDQDEIAAREYCEEWICKLYREGDFYLTDGTTYKEEDGKLVLEDPGEMALSVIKKEASI